MDEKHPFEAFNEASKPIIRDKSNVQTTPTPPAQSQFPRSNLSPMGTSGIKRGLPSLEKFGAGQRAPTQIDITKGDPEKGMFIDGTITGNNDYQFILKATNNVSDIGIDGGKITKLDLRKNGKTVALYNEGWQIKPPTSLDADALKKIENEFNGKPREFTPIAKNTPEKDRGFER